MTGVWDTIGACAGAMLPVFDLSLILHVIKRRSSKDISVVWAVGLWATSVAMAPAGLMSPDLPAKAFNVVNVVMLTAVVGVVIKYR